MPVHHHTRTNWRLRLFRALLALYPGEFRDEYGRELALVFADRYRDANGALERIRVCFDAVLGLLCEAPKEHLELLMLDLKFAIRSRGHIAFRRGSARFYDLRCRVFIAGVRCRGGEFNSRIPRFASRSSQVLAN